MKKKYAFTLAETLITLGVVGVIAAMSIPAIKKNSEEVKFVALAKKALATASMATQSVEAKYGESAFWNWDSANIVSWYKEFIPPVPPSNNTPWSTRQIDGTGQETFAMSSERVFMSNDGMAWYFSSSVHGKSILVDTNGPALPNVVGIDVHGFTVDNKVGLVPMGGDRSPNTVWACTAYVMKYGKMPWLTDTSITSCTQMLGK